MKSPLSHMVEVSHVSHVLLLGSFLLGTAISALYFSRNAPSQVMQLNQESFVQRSSWVNSDTTSDSIDHGASGPAGLARLAQILSAERDPEALARISRLAQMFAAASGPAGRHWTVTEQGELCFKQAYNIQGPQSHWHSLKWTPAVAPCTVRGLPIEHLDPEANFRRGYALGYTADVEDKTHVLPFMRAAHDPMLSTRSRRVLLDLGGKSFDSSVLWFLRMYPMAFTEVHVFEARKGVFQIPAKNFSASCQVITLGGSSRLADPACSLVPNDVLDSIHLHEKFVSVADKPGVNGSVPQVDITKFIKEELNLKRHDTVIVKMDIESAEWDVLPVWLQDADMPDIVDELFVEIHYQHPTMAAFGWRMFTPTRENATLLLQQLREKGFYVHAWP